MNIEVTNIIQPDGLRFVFVGNENGREIKAGISFAYIGEWNHKSKEEMNELVQICQGIEIGDTIAFDGVETSIEDYFKIDFIKKI
jgi:hypothetical protein